jgi:hypothetical protein
MVAAPTPVPNTAPVVALTEATEALLVLQEPPDTVADQVAEVPTHSTLAPVMVPAEPEAPTVTVVVAAAVPQALDTR